MEIRSIIKSANDNNEFRLSFVGQPASKSIWFDEIAESGEAIHLFYGTELVYSVYNKDSQSFLVDKFLNA